MFAKKTDGRVWHVAGNWKTSTDSVGRETNLDEVVLKTASGGTEWHTAFVRENGTLWVLNRYWDERGRQLMGTGVLQVGNDDDWRAVATTWGWMVALKADGSLWQWNYQDGHIISSTKIAPTRLGIHSDWVALAATWDSVVALAGDGSLWLWPDRISESRYGSQILMKLPKQPQFLGNVFSQSK